MDLVSSLIADVPDWLKPGVVFKDVIPLFAPPEGSRQTVGAVTASAPEAIDVVAGMEAWEFILAASVAPALGTGFMPVRKPGKLPRLVLSESFDLEYDTATPTMHADTLVTGACVFVVDDVFTTGDTVAATAALLERLGAGLAHVNVLLGLTALGGRERLADQGISGCLTVLTSQGRGQTEEAGLQGVCRLDGKHTPPTGAVVA